MENNKKFLPLWIGIGIILLVMLVILIVNFAPDTIKQKLLNRHSENTENVKSTIEHSLFESDTLSTESDTLSTESEISNESQSSQITPSDNTKPPNDNEDETIIDEIDTPADGLTKDSAWSLELNTEYSATMTADHKKHWFSIVTTDQDVIYRLHINPAINDSKIMQTIEMTVYDESGIKIQEGTTSYGKEYFFDVVLSPNTKYYIRIFMESLYQSSGDYMVRVREISRDPSTVTEKESAFHINVGQEYSGYLNTTFSNWYTCTFTQSGRYTFEIHNIDVGCKVYFYGKASETNSLFSGLVETENSNTLSFIANAGEQIYIELSPAEDIANGKYIFTIKKDSN